MGKSQALAGMDLINVTGMKGYLFSDLLIPPYFEKADGGNESRKKTWDWR